mgnify:CR=1 FL=1
MQERPFPRMRDQVEQADPVATHPFTRDSEMFHAGETDLQTHIAWALPSLPASALCLDFV